MTAEEIEADLVEFKAILQRIPRDMHPDNEIARRIYEGLILERLALARASNLDIAYS